MADNLGGMGTPAQSRAWRQALTGEKREKYVKENRARVLKWQREHPDVIKNRSARWRAEHPDDFEKARVALRKWRREHPIEVHLQKSRRRALEHGALGTCTTAQLRARIDMFGGMCWVHLLKGENRPYEAIDHVVALARGGTNWPANLRPICKSCNSRKGMKNYEGVRPCLR